MYFEVKQENRQIYFGYASILSSQLLNQQLSQILWNQETYIIAGLFTYVDNDQVIFQSGIAFFTHKLYFVKEKTFSRQWFEQHFTNTTYIYLEQTQNNQVVYRFYNQPQEINDNRLFISVWKDHQFFYFYDNVKRKELGTYLMSSKHIVPFKEVKYNANGIVKASGYPSLLPVYDDIVRYECVVNGLTLTPKVDYVVDGCEMTFSRPVYGVLRILTYDAYVPPES